MNEQGPKRKYSPDELRSLDKIGMFRVLEELDQKKKKLEASLAGILPRFETIPASEIQKIREIRALVHKRVDQYERELALLSPGQTTDNAYLGYVAKLEELLDSALNWRAKFTTESGSGEDDPISFDPKLDSTYYVTPSNTSFRLRRISLKEGRGLRGAIQPFAERIYYRGSGKDGVIHLDPKVGLYVVEIFNNEFSARIRAPGEDYGEFQSKIGIYEKDGRTLHIDAKSKDNIHYGDRINKIFK